MHKMYYKKITHFRKSTINFIWDQINPPWKKKAMRYEDTSILFFYHGDTRRSNRLSERGGDNQLLPITNITNTSFKLIK